MATAMRMAHATAICFGEPSMSFGFGHRFGSKSVADRAYDRTFAESADRLRGGSDAPACIGWNAAGDRDGR